MPRKTDYSQWDKQDLIAHIGKLEKRKQYGLVWNEEKTSEVLNFWHELFGAGERRLRRRL